MNAVHHQTGVDVAAMRVIEGRGVDVVVCPLCFSSVPTKCVDRHLDRHAERGDRVRT